jgi:hypothetical protein
MRICPQKVTFRAADIRDLKHLPYLAGDSPDEAALGRIDFGFRFRHNGGFTP